MQAADIDTLPVTPEEEEAWRAMPATALVRPTHIEAGCLARIKGTGANSGRIVRVLLPIQPGEPFGTPPRRWVPSALRKPGEETWIIAPVGDKPLIDNLDGEVGVLLRRESWLERIEEGATDDNDN